MEAENLPENIIPGPSSTFFTGNREGAMDVYSSLQKKGTAEFDADFKLDLKTFDSFSTDVINHFGPVIMLNAPRPFYICFALISYRIAQSRYSTLNTAPSEFQTWGTITLKNNFGHILIRPETILDKIHNIICPVELNFEEDQVFSRKYYVVVNDKLKAELYMTQAFRDCISKIEGEFVIEILGNQLIIGDKKPIQTETALRFAAFLKDISRVI